MDNHGVKRARIPSQRSAWLRRWPRWYQKAIIFLLGMCVCGQDRGSKEVENANISSLVRLHRRVQESSSRVHADSCPDSKALVGMDANRGSFHQPGLPRHDDCSFLLLWRAAIGHQEHHIGNNLNLMRWCGNRQCTLHRISHGLGDRSI